MSNVINWFEIPANNFERACDFYSKVMGTELQKMPVGELPDLMAFFHHEGEGTVGGSIIKGEGYVPSAEGSVIYLNGGNDLADPLSRVEGAGGKILLPKTAIGENGFIAHFMDTEGNRVAFHSMN
jgi:predicted enzyme related to lactoylglutathione lyase